MDKNFEDIWLQVKKMGQIAPSMIDHLPLVMSEQTKRILAGKTPQDVSNIVAAVIDEINKGSVDSVDSLISIYLNKL